MIRDLIKLSLHDRSGATRFRFVCAVVVVLLVGPFLARAFADDSSAGVMLPRLHVRPANSVTMTSAVVRIDGTQVALALTLTVHRESSITVWTPRFAWLGESNPYPDRQFPELRIMLNGTPAPVHERFRVFAGAVDISALVRAAGLDPFAIAETPPFVSLPADKSSEARQLARIGAISASPDGMLAHWSAQRRLAVSLKPGAAQRLTLRYAARPGYRLAPFDAVQTEAANAACLDGASLAALLGAPGPGTLFRSYVYAIAVGLKGHMPSRVEVSFQAGVHAHASSIVAFCGSEGKPIVGLHDAAEGQARPDRHGIVHIVEITSLPRP